MFDVKKLVKVAPAVMTMAAFIASDMSVTYADPPSWAPAHGWRNKHGSDDGDVLVTQPAPVYVQPAPVVTAAPMVCANGAVVGGVAGGVLGSIAGSQIAKGDARLATTAGGAILGALLGSAIGHSLDPNDSSCMGQAMAYAPVGRPIAWDNQGYGAQYDITPMRQYRRSGLVCRDYVAKAKINGRKQRVQGTACQQADGSWRVM